MTAETTHPDFDVPTTFEDTASIECAYKAAVDAERKAGEAFYADPDNEAAEDAYEAASAVRRKIEAALPRSGTWNGITDYLRSV